MNQATIDLIKTTLDAIEGMACESQMIPARAAFERGDYEHVLAITRGNQAWLCAFNITLPTELADGVAVTYDPEGRILSRGTHKDGVRVGLWERWWGNGNISSRYYYNQAGEPMGVWETWRRNGTLKWATDYGDKGSGIYTTM